MNKGMSPSVIFRHQILRSRLESTKESKEDGDVGGDDTDIWFCQRVVSRRKIKGWQMQESDFFRTFF